MAYPRYRKSFRRGAGRGVLSRGCPTLLGGRTPNSGFFGAAGKNGMKVPRFSIVTPSLNQCPYIEETIRSVIDQKGAFEIEYYVMDGGSTDGSVDLIARYADLVNSGRHPISCERVRMYW